MNASLRAYLLAFAGFILALVLSAITPVYAQTITAEALNQEGFSLLDSGSPAAALSVWQDAQRLYQAAGDTEGVTGTQLNQALAQQALGLQPLACASITEALDVNSRLCQPQARTQMVATELSKVRSSPANALGIRMLGESLGVLSNLEEAVATLEFARESASAQSPQLTFALANVYNLSFQSAFQNYKRISYKEIVEGSQQLSQAVEMSDKAISLYRVLSSSSNKPLADKASLNTISMFAHAARQASGNYSAEEGKLLKSLSLLAQSAYDALADDSFEQLSSIESIYTRLNLADSLLVIKAQAPQQSLSDFVSHTKIRQLIEEGLLAATQLDNHRALSSAYGLYGELLTQTGASQSLISEQYGRALSIAQAVRAYDIAYKWAYKLALVSEQLKDSSRAAQQYQNAITALSEVRNDLLAVNSELRFSFQEEIEPIYRDYIRFLAAREQPDLKEIRQVYNSLQLAQIENLLRCGRLVAPPQNPSQFTVHVINIGDVVQVIIGQGDNLSGYSAPATELLEAANSLNVNTRSSNFSSTPAAEFLPYAQQLYDGLLRPAIESGRLQDGQEIAFVLDSPFQSVPMGLLHDGAQYLITTHPISISLQMQQVRKSVDSSNALFVGLSEVAPSFEQAIANSNRFSPLPETEVEALYLNRYLDADSAKSAESLLNQDFTVARMDSKLSNRDFRIVHVSTHGQFSSTSEQTFLLAWDEPITLGELGRLFRRVESVDLLFLSACQAAAGDSRATLGLAGLAIQSGANNAIAPLWFQDSTGGSLLVEQFYEMLASEITPAKALQQSQIALMNSDAFSHPYYWASFVLASS